jgi:hypothetical protein
MKTRQFVYLTLSAIAALSQTQCSTGPAAVQAYEGATRASSQVAQIVSTQAEPKGKHVGPDIFAIDGKTYQQMRYGKAYPSYRSASVLPGTHRVTAAVYEKGIAISSLLETTEVSSPSMPGQIGITRNSPEGSVFIAFMDPRVDAEMEKIKRATLRTVTFEAKAGKSYILSAEYHNGNLTGRGIFVEEAP